MTALATTVMAVVAATGPAVAEPAQTAPTADGGSAPIVTGLQLNGDATQDGNALRLVPPRRNAVGSVFLKRRTSTRASFETHFVMTLNGGTTPPADGLAFVIQNDPRGAAAIGLGGSAHGLSGIAPSLAVDFNIYDYFGCNCPTNQIRLIENGDYGPTGYNGTALVTRDPRVPLYGAPVQVWIDYDAPAHDLSVFVAPASAAAKPSRPVLSRTVNLAALVGPSAFFGFTAATGALSARMVVRQWTVGPL